MATLQIRPEDPTQARAALVVLTLCDADGKQVTGYSTTGAVVASYSGYTDADGVLDLDVVPNSAINPEGTAYSLRIANRTIIITKGTTTETVYEALAGELGPLEWDLPQIIDGGDAASVSVSYTIDGGSA